MATLELPILKGASEIAGQLEASLCLVVVHVPLEGIPGLFLCVRLMILSAGTFLQSLTMGTPVARGGDCSLDLTLISMHITQLTISNASCLARNT